VTHPAVRRDDALLLGLVALLATVLDYRFGYGNQTEQLPLVLRALDPTLLEHDFYVRSAEGFGPRFYYVALLAGLGRALPLPVAMLGLTFVVNLGVGAVSFLAARRLLQASRLGAALAASLVLTVGGFPLGLVTDIRFQDLQPGSLAIPFALAALLAGLVGSPLRAAALATIASLPHPLYGLESGALALGSALIRGWLSLPAAARASDWLRASLPSAAGGALLALGALVFWGLPWAAANVERIPADEFVAVLSFRAPHHYLPSAFPARHYALLGLFLIASALAFGRWRQEQRPERAALAFLAAPIAILCLCLGGYLFVEVWPTRIWITAQPFRLLFLLKWQGLLLLGWLFGRWIGAGTLPSAVLGGVGLLAGGAAQPLVATGCLVADALDARLRRTLPAWPPLLLPGLAALALLPLSWLFGDARETLAMAVATLTALAFAPAWRPEPRSSHRIGVGALVLGVAVLAFANRANEWTRWEPLRPRMTWADHTDDAAQAARWARERTPREAIFLVPPGLDAFRIVARRAVVVDWKALPFPDQALREWRARMLDCYGPVTGGGFEALERLDRAYEGVDAATLRRLGARYGASHALLYRATEVDLPVLYANAGYKIVLLGDPAAAAHPSRSQRSYHSTVCARPCSNANEGRQLTRSRALLQSRY